MIMMTIMTIARTILIMMNQMILIEYEMCCGLHEPDGSGGELVPDWIR